MVMEQDFRNKFTKQYFKSSAGTLRFIDVAPEEYTSTILFLSGWSEVLESVQTTIFALFKEGYRVIAADYRGLHDFVSNNKGLPQAEYVKSLALVQLLEKRKVEQVDIIAHSEGAITGSILASTEPDMVDVLMLVTPAGMMAHDNFFLLSGRFFWYLMGQFRLYVSGTYRSAFKYLRGVITYALTNPLQVTKEALGITNFNLAQVLQNINPSQVRVCLIHSKSDEVFPLHEIEVRAEEAGIHAFHTVEGGHNELNVRPEYFVKAYQDFKKNNYVS